LRPRKLFEVKEIVMRDVVGPIVGIGMLLVASPGSAESFDTKYPVCMEVYASGGPRLDCYFWSMEQCWVKTDGMAAVCFANRNYVPTEPICRHSNPAACDRRLR
jgi:hypothetical protein